MGKRKTVDTVWAVWTYDVWGNKKEGYEVNDCRCEGEVCLRLKAETFNEGTPLEFDGAAATDRQIGNVFGTKAMLDVDGDDMVYYVNRASDGYPIGELRCVSHDSLSPIRVRDAQGTVVPLSN